jgi:hypothetical protein
MVNKITSILFSQFLVMWHAFQMTDRLKPTFLTSSPFLQSFMDSDEEKDVDARDYFTAVYRVGEEGTDYTLEIPKDQASGNAIRKLIQLKYGRDVGTLYYWSKKREIWSEVKHDANGDGVRFLVTSLGLSLDLSVSLLTGYLSLNNKILTA